MIAYHAAWNQREHHSTPSATRPATSRACPTRSRLPSSSARSPSPTRLRAITGLVAAWASTFTLDPDGIRRGGTLGAERMARQLADTLPAEHPLRAAVWAFLGPMLSPRLAEPHRGAFTADGEP